MDNLAKLDIEKELIAITTQLLIQSGEYKREIKLSSSLQQHLRIDSLGRAELFQRIEKAFGIRLPDRMLVEVETLNDIAVYLYAEAPNIKKELPRQVVTPHTDRVHIDMA